jgi:murein DD-endopeptidase MepM/ murein hydrolase activator NlpD
MALNVESLIDQFIDLISGKKSTQIPVSQEAKFKERTTAPVSQDKNYQAPIKGSFGNSGNYSPNAPTDARHKTHKGVDLRTFGGTSVYPMLEGTVISISSGGKGGNTITIQHPNNIKTYYAHLGTVAIHKDDKVTKDTVIGTVGDSGNALGTFPHVHFQVWKDGQIQDPGSFFSVPKYSEPKGEQTWVSDKAKQEARSFNINEHMAKEKSSLAININEIEKLAEEYYRLAKL